MLLFTRSSAGKQFVSSHLHLPPHFASFSTPSSPFPSPLFPSPPSRRHWCFSRCSAWWTPRSFQGRGQWFHSSRPRTSHRHSFWWRRWWHLPGKTAHPPCPLCSRRWPPLGGDTVRYVKEVGSTTSGHKITKQYSNTGVTIPFGPVSYLMDFLDESRPRDLALMHAKTPLICSKTTVCLTYESKQVLPHSSQVRIID